MHRCILLVLLLLMTVMAPRNIMADDNQVHYSVVAFPDSGQSVGVMIEHSGNGDDGKVYALSASEQYPHLYSGMAPFSQVYQYALTDATSGSVVELESEKRSLSQGASSTGNEFFGRAPTVYSVPELPQAFHPVYPRKMNNTRTCTKALELTCAYICIALFTNMNQSNEVATILLDLEQAELDAILANPHAKHKDAHVHKMTFISNSEIHTFTNAKLDNSGQSTKNFNRQSFEISLEKPQLLFGRRDFKLRAEQTDSSFMQVFIYYTNTRRVMVVKRIC